MRDMYNLDSTLKIAKGYRYRRKNTKLFNQSFQHSNYFNLVFSLYILLLFEKLCVFYRPDIALRRLIQKAFMSL